MSDSFAPPKSASLGPSQGALRDERTPTIGPGQITIRTRRSPQEEFSRPVLQKMAHAPQESLSALLSSIVEQSRRPHPGLLVREIGTVRQVGDGVASVWGLPGATTDEILQFPHGVTGLVMNLETSYVDCILLGSDEGIQGGDLVWSTGKRIAVPVGDRLLGRVIDPLGTPLDTLGRLFADELRFIERNAPGVVERQPIAEPLQTGIKAVDAIVPIGRGQRELIVGDRQTGKTAIALDAIINQRGQDVVCLYVSIGQRKSAVLDAIRILDDAGAMEHTVVIMAAPDDPPALVYIAPYTGATIAESFMDQGRDVLIIYDDLTKHADAYRELSLLLRRPPGREAYPGDIFYLHSRLLERSGRLNDNLGGGSITALPIVETRRGNISAYVPTNLISITDGQIYLSPELFNQGFKPAIDVGLSVSRVGGAAQTPIMRQVGGHLRLMLSQYEEVAQFSRFGTEVDEMTRRQIVRGEHLRQALRQIPYRPLQLSRQILVLYAAGEGYMDDIPLVDVERFESELWAFAIREYRSIVRRVDEDHVLDDRLAGDMKDLLEAFVSRFA